MMGFWGCSGISWTICKQSAPRCRQITTLTPHQSIFTGRILFLTPNQQRQSTEGNDFFLFFELFSETARVPAYVHFNAQSSLHTTIVFSRTGPSLARGITVLYPLLVKTGFLLTSVSPAETTEPIGSPFGVMT